jgi:predicted Holliday junction resolvase-like endonuclease
MNEILSTFQAFRRVLCLCPHCNALLRLSDLQLKYRGAAPKTWLDSFETKLSSAEEKEALFDEKEEKLHDQAVKRGRHKVPMMIRKSMDLQFAKLEYNPYDIKALFHPVDFVVFDGMESKKHLRNIIFLSKAVNNEQLNGFRNSIQKAVEERKYDWQVARVSIDGKIEMTES